MKFTRFLMKTFGAKFCYLIMIFPTMSYFLFSKRARLSILAVYKSVYGIDKKWLMFRIFKNFWNFGCSVVDRLSYDKVKMEFSPQCETVDLVPGSIYLGAHFGECLMAPMALANKKNSKVGVLIDTSATPEFTKLTDSLGKNNIEFISTKDNGPIDLAFKVRGLLDEGGCLCMVGDRELVNTPQIEVPFLDSSISVSVLPFKLIRFLNKPVYFFTSTKEGSYDSNMYLFKNQLVCEKSGDLDEKSIAGKYISMLEAEVKVRPEHWFNFKYV